MDRGTESQRGRKVGWSLHPVIALMYDLIWFVVSVQEENGRLDRPVRE